MIDPERSSAEPGAGSAAGAARAAPESGPAPIESRTLMQGRREVTILHAGERYRLRVTANDKLILTK